MRARPELRVQVGPTRYRVPDIVVLDSALPVEQIATRAPLAGFEVLCLAHSMQCVLQKLSEYAVMGITQIWGIDPKRVHYFGYAEDSLERAETFGLPGERMHFAMQEVAALFD